MNTRILLLLGILFSLCPSLIGQSGLHLQFMPEQIASQWYQPANLNRAGFETVSFGADAGYFLNSNVISLDAIFQDGNYISNESKAKIIDQMGNDNRVQQDIQYGLAQLNFRAANHNFGFTYRNLKPTYIRVNNPETAGLVLYGNSPYAGQTITDENVATRTLDYHEIGFLTALTLNKLHLGVKAKFLLGKSAWVMDRFDYSFFTESDGTLITLDADYDFMRSGYDGGLQGTGFGFDLGAVYELSEKLTFQASATDLGMIVWDGITYQNKVAFAYSGFEIDDLFNAANGSFDFLGTDSLRTLLIPDSTFETFTTPLPAALRIGVDYRLTEKDRLLFSLYHGLTEYAPATKLPQLSVAYHRKLSDVFTLGANVYGGGMDLYGFGLMGQAQIPLGEKMRLNIFLLSDNLLGFIAPSVSKGLSVNGGLTLSR
jgi:hypothetical protein